MSENPEENTREIAAQVIKALGAVGEEEVAIISSLAPSLLLSQCYVAEALKAMDSLDLSAFPDVNDIREASLLQETLRCVQRDFRTINRRFQLLLVRMMPEAEVEEMFKKKELPYIMPLIARNKIREERYAGYYLDIIGYYLYEARRKVADIRDKFICLERINLVKYARPAQLLQEIQERIAQAYTASILL